MKLLIVLLFILPEILISQDLVISTKNKQVVYVNIENPINTNLSCFNKETLLLTNNGEIIDNDDGTYWKPSNEEWTAYLKLVEIHKRDTSLLDSVQFKVALLGLPMIELNLKEFHSGLGNYLSSTKLKFSFKEAYKFAHLKWQEKIRIESFQMKISIFKNTGEVKKYIFESKSDKLPKEYNEIKKELKVDDVLVIELEKIKINCTWQPETKYYDEVWDGLPFLKIKWTWKILKKRLWRN